MVVVDVPAHISWCDVWWAFSAPAVLALLLFWVAWVADRRNDDE